MHLIRSGKSIANFKLCTKPFCERLNESQKHRARLLFQYPPLHFVPHQLVRADSFLETAQALTKCRNACRKRKTFPHIHLMCMFISAEAFERKSRDKISTSWGSILKDREIFRVPLSVYKFLGDCFGVGITTCSVSLWLCVRFSLAPIPSIQLQFDELNMNAFIFCSLSLSVAPFKFSKVFFHECASSPSASCISIYYPLHLGIKWQNLKHRSIFRSSFASCVKNVNRSVFFWWQTK